MAKEMTLDELRSKIQSKEQELAALKSELDGLKKEARELLLTMAGEFGVDFGGEKKAKKATTTGPKPDVVSFLNKALADSPLNEEQIRAAYKKAYPNSRLFLGKYVTDKVVKKSKDGMYSIA